jgi:hypothetical protein
MIDVKRLKYFNHQFLNEKDFQDEQAYHVFMRRLHNRTLHTWGVVEGLTVEKRTDREIVVRPGIALDREGREIVLANEIQRDTRSSEGGGHAFVTIAYEEVFREDDRQNASEVESYQRTSEIPKVHLSRQAPLEEGPALILARVHLDGSGNIDEIDSWGRQAAGTAIGPGAVGTAELAEDSVTKDKLAPGSVTEEALASALKGSFGARGWFRMTFKPAGLPAKRAGSGPITVLDHKPEEFISDIAFASCGTKGASGSMSIPAPPGATKVKAFRLAGTTKGTVMAQLMRTGWNAHDNRGESVELLNEMINDPIFNRHVEIAEHLRILDPHFHALAISVSADNEAKIWLVAVEFE